MKVSLLTVAFSFFLIAAPAYAGPTPPTGNDTDGDGVENEFDNCLTVSNTLQGDVNHNGCGNLCDVRCNWNSPPDNKVDTLDFLVMGSMWNGMGFLPGTNGDCAPVTSMGQPSLGDGDVNTLDYLQLGSEWNDTAGPSGITNEQCNPLTCLCTPQ